jgi:hypothetical protein
METECFLWGRKWMDKYVSCDCIGRVVESEGSHSRQTLKCGDDTVLARTRSNLAVIWLDEDHPSTSETRPLVEEQAPYRNTYKYWKEQNVATGPETKIDCAGEGPQPFTGLDEVRVALLPEPWGSKIRPWILRNSETRMTLLARPAAIYLTDEMVWILIVWSPWFIGLLFINFNWTYGEVY